MGGGGKKHLQWSTTTAFPSDVRFPSFFHYPFLPLSSICPTQIVRKVSEGGKIGKRITLSNKIHKHYAVLQVE